MNKLTETALFVASAALWRVAPRLAFRAWSAAHWRRLVRTGIAAEMRGIIAEHNARHTGPVRLGK